MKRLHLLKKITLVCSTAFLLCLTTATIPTVSSIITEIETSETPNKEQQDSTNQELEPELQPLSDDPDNDTTKIPFF